ncbi:helix-turn-helix domain-containing protein [uncultured Amnibacterium sp.]|uniref:helix-turn-helix domain-containing protein n=1 Tax=uncultured Amnibacterium sp. TaxID=1631851 RepID=UPI0035CA93D2
MAETASPSRLRLAGAPSRPEPAASGMEPLWRHMLGDRLRAVRHDRGETLGETAARAGVSPQYLSEMERGAKEPSSEMIAAVAGALETTLLDLTVAVADGLREARAAATSGAVCRVGLALAA